MHTPLRRRALAAGALAALIAAAIGGPALAASEDGPDATFGLTGDWNGLRTRLEDDGWTFDIRQKLEGAYNATGGTRSSADGAGETRIGVIADLDKLAHLSGGTVHLMLTRRYGAGLGEPSGIDPLMSFIEVHGRGDIWRLTQLWYDQTLAGGAVDLKLGRMNPGSDFDAFACDFQNLTFCGSQPGNLEGDYWYNWPVSQWGARAKLKLGKDVYVQAGAYQVNPQNLAQGFTFNVSRGTGVLTPVEVGWTPKLGPNSLPGTYLAGAWYSNTHGADPLLGLDGQPQPLTGQAPLQHAGRYGGYVSVTQQVTGKADGPGLSLFGNFTQGDARTSQIDRQIALGAEYKGLFPGRAKDVLALAIGRTHINDRLTQAEQLANGSGGFGPVQHSEDAAELDYRVQVVKGAVITPNLQYVSHAGGIAGRDALVLGVKAVLKL